MITIKQATFYTFILSLISPFLGLVLGLKTLNRRGKQQLLTIFGLFYGLLLTYPEGSDASTHAENLKRYYNLGLSDFFDWTEKNDVSSKDSTGVIIGKILKIIILIAHSSGPSVLAKRVGRHYAYCHDQQVKEDQQKLDTRPSNAPHTLNEPPIGTEQQ